MFDRIGGYLGVFVCIISVALMSSCATAPSAVNNTNKLILLNQDVDGWARDGETIVCSNLAELSRQINGGASYYFDKGARKVIFQDFKKPDGDAYINCEIYQMKKQEMAEDIFNDSFVEQPVSLPEIGEKARLAGNLIGVYSIDFFKDNVYTRLVISEKNDKSKEELHNFAQSISSRIDTK